MKFFCFSRNHYYRLYVLLLCFVALLSGGTIYVLFRTSEPVFFSWIRLAGLESRLSFVRNSSLSLNRLLPEWIIYSLPNGLWAFAYALLITCIWAESKSRLKYFWMASIPVLVIGFEILQGAGMIPGTFCLQDIVFGTAGIISGVLSGSFLTKLNNHEKSFE
jgi:hypothetical protein